MNTLLILWRRLVTPPHVTAASLQYSRHYTLLLVLVSLIVTASLLCVIVPFFVVPANRPLVIAACGSGIIWFSLLYRYARRGHYVFTATATVLFITLAICGVTVGLGQEPPLRFLALSSMVGVLLFSRRGALRVLMLNMAAVVATTQLLPLETASQLLDNSLLIFLLSLALLIVVETNEDHRQRIEGQTQALLDAQKRELAWVAENERARVTREWIAFMSHDFRTPLAVMSTTLYVMERNFKPELNPQRIKTLTHQTERLAGLISNMHAAVSLDAQVTPNTQIQDVTPLIEDMLVRLGPLATEHKIHLHPHLASPLPHIPLDTDAFRLAFYNVLENAVLYNKTGGTVTLRSQIDTEYLRLIVEDTGIGIAPTDLPFIFDRFYRVDKARQIDLGRNGLGLSIAKLVVEAHHGRIEVKSVLGEGSTFTIYLPLTPSPDNAAQ